MPSMPMHPCYSCPCYSCPCAHAPMHAHPCPSTHATHAHVPMQKALMDLDWPRELLENPLCAPQYVLPEVCDCQDSLQQNSFSQSFTQTATCFSKRWLPSFIEPSPSMCCQRCESDSMIPTNGFHLSLILSLETETEKHWEPIMKTYGK